MFGNENKAIDCTQQLISDEKQNSPNLFTTKLLKQFRRIQQHIIGGMFGPQKVNINDQKKQENSFSAVKLCSLGL